MKNIQLNLKLRLSFTFILAFSLLGLLSWSLTACQASGRKVLPQLLAVIEMPDDIGGGTARGVINPTNGWAYIINEAGSIAILDGPELVKVMPLPGRKKATWMEADIAVDEKTGYVFVTDELMGAVHVISSTHYVTTIPNVGMSPEYIEVHPETGYVYVANVWNEHGMGEIAVISNTRVITRLEVGHAPQTLAINPVDGNVYVGQLGPSSERPTARMLAIIHGSKLVTQTNLGLSMSASIYDIAVNPNTGEMYMIRDYGTLIYWDRAHDIRMANLYEKGDYGLNSVGVETKRNWAYATSWDGPPSHVVVLQKDKVIKEIEVPGYDIRDVVYDATYDYVYVANRLSGSMSIIRGTKVITTVSTGGIGPTYITVDEKRGYVYVSNADTHSVAVFGYHPQPNEGLSWKRFLPFLQR